jgi:hypothetical protein
MPSDPVHIARSRLARTVASHGRGSPEAIDAKRELIAAKIIREIASATTDAPTLTAEQRRRIADLLLTAPGGAA